MIGKTLGHYRIVEKIGAGGMGEVYRAHDESLDRDVALKVLPASSFRDPSARARLLREARTASQLNHPHICTIHEVGEAEGQAYIAMEYVAGQPLDRVIPAGGLPGEQVLRYGVQIADALAHAHERGIVHRDLKSANVMITPEGRAKVLDFGLAKRVSEGELDAVTRSQASLTTLGALVGTLAYMAPEQLRGQAADARSDVWALGVVLYEMAAGERPFQGQTGYELSSAILREPLPALPPGVPVSLRAVIERCLAKEPRERYQRGGEVRAVLEAVQAGAVAPWVGWRYALSRRRLLAVAAVSLLALVAVLVGLRISGLWQGLQTGTSPEQIDSIVALPSKVFAAAEDSFLTDAIPNTLSTQLTQVAGLETKLPPTSIEVERVGGDVDKVADAYQVGALVLSTVTAQSDSLILNVQLVEAGSRRLLWSSDYRGRRADYIEVVTQAAEGLRAALRPSAAPVVTVAGVASSSEAELLYRRGRYYVIRYSHLRQPEDWDLAFSALENALKLDPKLADAAALIGGLFAIKADFQLSSQEENIREMENWARRALEIDPRSGQGWGILLRAERARPRANNRKVLEYGLRAVAFGAEEAGNHRGFGHALSGGGSLVLAEAAYREAYRLDPLSLHSGANLARVLNYSGRSQEALTVLDEVLRLEPDMAYGLQAKAECLIMLGRAQEAAEIAKRLEARNPGSLLQFALALERGDRETVQAGLRFRLKIITAPQIPHLTRQGVGRVSFGWLARAGEAEAALEVATALAEAGGALHYDWRWVSHHKNVQAFLGDPRFKKLDALSRAQFEETISILEEARARGELPTYLETPLADLLAQMRSDPGFQSLLRRMEFPED